MTSPKLPLHHQRYPSRPCTNSLPSENADLKTRDLILEQAKLMNFFVKRYNVIFSNAKVELAVLSQFLYKNHNRFRNDKCQKTLKMIEKTANRFFQELSLDKECSKFSEIFPIAMDIKHKETLYLPTSQMLDFILARFYGGAHLLWKLIVYCQNGGEQAIQRIKLGHFWNIGLNNISCVSRLWALSISLLVLVEMVYRQFLRLLPILPDPNSLHKRSNVDHPKNIAKVILQEDCESFYQKFKQIVKNDSFPVFIEDLEYSNVKTIVHDSLCVDVGKIVSRDSMSHTNDISSLELPSQIQGIQSTNISKSTQSDDIPFSDKRLSLMDKKIGRHTKTSHNLSMFVEEENKLRKTNRKASLTKILRHDQWKALRKDLKNVLENLPTANNDKIKEGKLLEKCKNMIIGWILYPNRNGILPDSMKEVDGYFSNNRKH